MALRRWGDNFGAGRFPEILWADLYALDPAAHKGAIYRVLDIGPDAGALINSDGTYWTPLNGGPMTLGGGAELGVTITASASYYQVPGWSLLIPAGLFRKPGSFLRASFKGRRTGTLGASALVNAYIGWGSDGFMHLIGSEAGGTTNNAIRGIGMMSRVNDTQVRNNHASINYGNLGEKVDNVQSSLRTLPVTDVMLYVYGRLTNPGVDEVCVIDEISVELITP